MVKRIQQLLFMGALIYACYFLLSHHVIFFGKKFELLKKAKLTLDHTVYSPGDRKEIDYKGLDSILMNDDLRKAGLGELLVEKGLITEDELREAEDRIDYAK